MSESLRFRKLDVRRMYGRVYNGAAVSDDFSSGINIIYGSNASGKSTLAQAICAALWPDHVLTDDDDLTAFFELGDNPWRVDIKSRKYQVQRNGAATSLPALPPGDNHRCYHLYLHELLHD